MSKLDDIIRKVEGLIAKAEGTENNHEADAFRTKAEAMMLQYRIEESQVGKGGQASVSEALPQWEDIVVCSSTSSFRWSYVDLLITVARHMDVRHELANQVDNETGGMNVVAQCVGYESDLRFLRVLLFTPTSSSMLAAQSLPSFSFCPRPSPRPRPHSWKSSSHM